MALTLMRRMAHLLIALVLLFVLLGLAIRLLERRLVYHPRALEAGALAELVALLPPGEETFEEVEFAASDGVRLTGWLGLPPQPRAWVLWLHGNGGNVSHRWEDFRRLVRDLGLAVLIPDYRGYGRSEGKPSEEGLQLDARAAWDYALSRGATPERTVLLGRSLGGAVAVELAGHRSAAGLVIESTFTDVPAMARATVPFFPGHWFLRSRYPTIDRLPALTLPVLHFHGTEDEIVPFRMGEELAAASRREGYGFVAVRGARHNDLSSRLGDAYFERFAAFVASAVPE